MERLHVYSGGRFSVAFDSIETPSGPVDHAWAARPRISPWPQATLREVRVIAVVGEDFTASNEACA